MVKLICVLILIFALSANNIVAGQALQSSINAGTLTVRGQFPSVVSITSSVQGSNCLGNIINEWHVLTAASCVLQNNAIINPFWLTITAADLILNVPTWRRIVRNVTTIYPHPQFNSVTNVNNLAVLRVGAMFPFPHNTIEAARLATQPIMNNCRFVGWSVTGVQPALQLQQHSINVPLIQPTTCAASHGTGLNMICGGMTGVNQPSPCPGALGGGLYCGADDQLVGILALNTPCGSPVSIYIEVRFYLAWITQQFARTVRFAPGTHIQQIN